MKPRKKKPHIHFRDEYKYQLFSEYVYADPIRLGNYYASTDWLHLESGAILIRAGYCWDGPSGPACDTLNFMRASLVHDALYQLMREGLLPQEFRKTADKIMQEICKEDGMWAPRRWWVYRAVRRFAARAADPKYRKQVRIAP